jgi:hypothetical protein
MNAAVTIIYKKRINKQRLASILLHKGSSLCDDMISTILEFIGYNKGILDLRKILLTKYAYENYRLERRQLYNMHYENSLEICNILYKKLPNYNVVQIAQIIQKQTLFDSAKIKIRDKFEIIWYKNMILNIYNKLCKKIILRENYEYRMYHYNTELRRVLIHFLKFDYMSLPTNERKKYLSIFNEIRELTLFMY